MSITRWFCWVTTGIGRKISSWRNLSPCVGIVMLGGCLLFVIAPDVETGPKMSWEPKIFTVVIDPGHGGRDDGARGSGLVEKELTLDVALRLNRILQEKGVRTLMTRSDDSRVGLAARAAIANGVDDAIFVSIHFNQSSQASARGVETYFAPEKVPEEKGWTWVGFFNRADPLETDNGEELARYLQGVLVAGIDATDRGIRGRALYVVRHVRGPAVLIEGGFLSNPAEARLLAKSEYRERLASAVAAGLIQFQQSKRPIPGPTQLAKNSR